MTPEAIAEALAKVFARDHASALQRAATPRPLAAGETLLEANAPSHTLYFVCDGELAIATDDATELGRCGAGAIVGEVSTFDGGPASATVTAARTATVLGWDREALDALYRDHPHAATALMQELCATLAARIRASSDLFEQLTTGQVAPPRTSWFAALKALFVSSRGAA